jgi:hypothetical protein
VDACVWLPWVRPLKSTSALRPLAGGSPGWSFGASSEGGVFGLKLFVLAQASINVPSREKCSSDTKGTTAGSTRIATRNLFRNVTLQQTLAVLGEDLYVPHGRINRKPDKPAEHRIIL